MASVGLVLSSPQRITAEDSGGTVTRFEQTVSS